MVQLFRASDLPPDVPGIVISDGDDTAVVINAHLAAERGTEWTRGLANALLAEAGSRSPTHLQAVV